MLKPSGKDCTSWLDIGMIVCMILLILIPFAMVIYAFEAEPYYTVAGEPVKDAAAAAGITLAHEQASVWNVNGALGGKTYTLTDSSGNTVTIATQKFDSAESRDAIVQLYQATRIGKTKSPGNLIVVGQYVVYVTPANSPVLAELAPFLKKTTST